MTFELLATLGALALADSLSIGTLLIPIFFLVAPGRLRAGRVALYLATVAVFYLLVGLVLAAGADAAMRVVGDALHTTAARIVQLVAGVVLFALSFWIGRKRPEGAAAGPGRLTRWRDRALGDGPVGAVILLGLAAASVEVATMLPYLGAIGLMTSAGLSPLAWVATLAAYCAVMVLPAFVLLLARVAARSLVEPQLARFASWLQKNSAENTAWIVGIVGFLLARDALSVLGVF